MLIDETTLARNPATGRIDQVLSSNFGIKFEQVSPTVGDLKTWASNAAIVGRLESGENLSTDTAMLGDRIATQLPALVGLRCVDWAQAQEHRAFAMATKIGLVQPEDIGALTSTAHAVVAALASVRETDSGILAEDLVKKVAFDFWGMTSGFISGVNPYLQLAVSIISFVAQIGDMVAELRRGDARKASARLPIYTADGAPETDSGIITLMDDLMLTSRDWTDLALPSTQGDWNLFEVGNARPAELGFAVARTQGDPGATAGPGFGFMPGTSRTQGVMQFVSRWTSVRDIYDDRRDGQGRLLPPTANWGSHLCDPKSQEHRAFGTPCLQSAEAFTGGVNCRQCIPIDSIRGTSRGDWREYANAFITQAVNTDDLLINSTQSLAAIFESISVNNPSSWCFDTAGIFNAWRDYWETFFEFIPRAWNQNDAYPWRALLSNFAALALISNEDGKIGGAGTLLDWRIKRWGEYDKGIVTGATPGIPPVYSGLPADADCESKDFSCSFADDRTSLQRITSTPFLLEHSIFARAIAPALTRIAGIQLAGYKTTMVAYLWGDQGAHFDADTGKLRDNVFGLAYEDNLRALINTPRLRNAVHMGHVVDPNVRQLLVDAGARPAQTGTQVLAPQVTRAKPPKPPRARPHSDNPIVTFAAGWVPPPGIAAPLGGFPAEPPTRTNAEGLGTSALVVGGLAALAGLFLWTRR